MARRILLVLCASLLALSVVSPASAQMRLGVKGGLNFADIADLDEDVSASSESDFVGGAFVMFGVSSRLRFQVEALYSKRSAALVSENTKGTLTQDFFEVPLILGVALMKGIINPRLYGGASASFESGCNVTIDEGLEASGDCKSLFGADSENTQWAAIAGLSLDVHLTVVSLLADVRYNYGLSSIVQDADATWRYWSVMVGASIGIGG